MAFEINLTTAGPHDKGYRVQNRDGCKYIFGLVPLSDAGDLMKAGAKADKTAIASNRLADLAGATLAFGPLEDVEAAIASLIETRRQTIANGLRAQDLTLPAGLEEWLASGLQGKSSRQIVLHLCPEASRFVNDGGVSHPKESGPLIYCRLLLEAVPAFKTAFNSLATISPSWASVVDAWPELCTLMDEEQPEWRSTDYGLQRTEARLRAVLESALSRVPVIGVFVSAADVPNAG